MKAEFQKLKDEIISCEKCPRLSQYIRKTAVQKVKRFNNWEYWGRPVPGFGDRQAEVFIIGLAPAAHGGNRTGRMFTGDSSGDWLYKALYETGFANQPESFSREDGLVLQNVFISAVARCAPPDNKPLPQEIENCSAYLQREMGLLKCVRVIVCLGHLAFNRFCKMQNIKGLVFAHGNQFKLEDGITLVCSYHPSRQNTNTGRLKWDEWLKVFQDVRKISLV